MPSVQDRLRCVKMRERFFVYALPRSRVARLPVRGGGAGRARGARAQALSTKSLNTKIKKVIISEFSRHVY